MKAFHPKKLSLAILGFVLVSHVFTAYPASAVSLGLKEAKDLAKAQKIYMGTAQEAVQKVISFILSIAAVVALAALVWAGFLYISSFTNEKNIEKAKHVALYAIMGLIFMAVAFLILKLIEQNFTS